MRTKYPNHTKNASIPSPPCPCWGLSLVSFGIEGNQRSNDTTLYLYVTKAPQNLTATDRPALHSGKINSFDIFIMSLFIFQEKKRLGLELREG